MVSPQLAAAAASTRTEADVALGRLMAAIEDASTAYSDAWGAGFGPDQRNSKAAELLEKILTAKGRYDAARLASGASFPELYNGMVEICGEDATSLEEDYS